MRPLGAGLVRRFGDASVKRPNNGMQLTALRAVADAEAVR